MLPTGLDVRDREPDGGRGAGRPRRADGCAAGRRRDSRRFYAALVLAMLGGSNSGADAETAASRDGAGTADRAAVSGRGAPGPPSEAAETTPAYATHGDGRLAALIAEALDRNPRIREAHALWQASRHRAPQAAALPDPVLAVTQHARLPQTRVGPQTTVLSVTQPVPGFGKRALRGQVAAKAAEVRAELHRAQRAEVVRLVKRAYYDLGYVDRALAISREEEELLRHSEVLARSRYAQGFGQQADVLRLQAEITRALNRREDLRRRRVDAEALLNALLDRDAAAPIRPVTLGARPAPELDGDALAASGRARPEVQAAQRRIEGAEREMELARRQRRPDFSVGVSWGHVLGRRDPAGRAAPPAGDGQDVYSVMFGMSLPFFRAARYDAAFREAAERSTSARAAYRTTVAETERAVRSTGFRLQSIERQIALFENALLPQAGQSLIATEAAYAAGGAGVVDLLDSQRVLLDVRFGLARLDVDYLKALADLERSVGAAVPEAP